MNRIRELREEKKITQIRLSIELEVSQETISAYEMEKYFPSIKSLIKLRQIFGVPIDYSIIFPGVHKKTPGNRRYFHVFEEK